MSPVKSKDVVAIQQVIAMNLNSLVPPHWRSSPVRLIKKLRTPVRARFDDGELAIADRLVSEGVGESRSDVIRQAVRHLDDSIRRTRDGQAIADSCRRLPQSDAEHAQAMASAIALAEAEPW